MKLISKKGFTLAEVLVTLGIIGVISAMTIPTLVKNHQRTVYVTQLKKVVTELSQAAERATNDSNAVSLRETKYRSDANLPSFLSDYFKVVKNCGTTLTPCFADSYETMSGDTFTLETPKSVVSLASGASISIFAGLGVGYSTVEHGYLQMQVDVNGRQGPNILGRDLFYLELYDDGKIAEGYTSDWSASCLADSVASYGAGCFSKILNDGWVMDY